MKRKLLIFCVGIAVLAGTAGVAIADVEGGEDRTFSPENESILEAETTAQSISYGETVESELSEESTFDTDFNGYYENFTFEGEAGDVISIEMRPDTENGAADEEHAVRLELYDPDGERIETAWPGLIDYGATSINEVELEESGTYTVVATTAYYSGVDPYASASDTYYDTFEYELRLHEFHGDGEAIEYGDTVEETLSENSHFADSAGQNGYYDVYTFKGEAGDVVSAEMRPATGDGAAGEEHAVRLELYDPDGERIETAWPGLIDYGATSFNEVELEESGTYTVVATTAYYSSVDPYTSASDTYHDTFEYELRLHEFHGDGEAIEYGDTVEDALSENSHFADSAGQNGYYDVYTFDGEKDEVISVEMRPKEGESAADEEHAVRLELYDPDGERIETAWPELIDYGATSINEVELEESGTYTVVATTAYYSSVDPYTSARDTYHDTFEYELRLHEFHGDGKAIEYGDTVEDSLSENSHFADSAGQNGYYDVHTFDGEDGDLIDLSMIPEDDPSNDEHAARIELYDPDGERIETTWPNVGYGAASMSEIELEESGTYTVVATTAYYSGVDAYTSARDTYHDTFEYELQLYESFGGTEQELEPDETFTNQLTTDDIYTSEFVGYHDRYSFEGEAGDVVSGEMRVAIPDEQAAQLRLYGPDGERLTSERTERGSAHMDRIELEETGTHTLVATTSESYTADVYSSTIEARTDTFQYELRFYEFVGERELLVDGDAIQSNLEPDDNFQESFVGYYDAYVTTAMEGDTFSVEMNIDQADSNAAQMIVLGPDGSTVASTNEGSGSTSLEVTAEDTGEHTIVATTEWFSSGVYDTRDEAEQATFQYQLVFEGPDNNPPLIEDADTDPDRAAVGEVVELDVEASDPNHDTLSYEWEQVIGAFPDPEVDIENADSATATFIAPDVDAETQLTFEVTVSDGDGGEVTEEIDMIVDPDIEPEGEPTAVVTVDPEIPTVGEEVTFDASDSMVPGGEIESYEWTIDGTIELEGETATHTFEEPGEYEVTLTVTDDDGQSDITTETIIVEDGTPDDDPSVGDYADDDGVVQPPGVLEAIDDWRDDKIDTPLVLEVIDAWRSGQPIT